MHWIYLIHEFHDLSWITEINELFHDILIYWDAPVYAAITQNGVLHLHAKIAPYNTDRILDRLVLDKHWTNATRNWFHYSSTYHNTLPSFPFSLPHGSGMFMISDVIPLIQAMEEACDQGWTGNRVYRAFSRWADALKGPTEFFFFFLPRTIKQGQRAVSGPLVCLLHWQRKPPNHNAL